MRPFALNLVAAGTFALCAAAHADPVSVEFLDYAHGSSPVTFAVTGGSGSTNAGGFTTRLNGVGPTFTSYCIDLFHYITLPGSYPVSYSDIAGSAYPFAKANALTDLAKLFSRGHAVVDATSEAAFQLAVWEIVYETDKPYAVGNGNAVFTGNALVTALADSWLTDLVNGTVNGIQVRVLDSSVNQDEVYFRRVPEPGTWSLGLAALGLMAWISRRRRA